MRISDWSSDVCSSDRGAVARDIEPVGFGRRAGEQLDPIFIERVDQRDKARRLVAVFRAHARYADDDHAVEMARDGEIVGSAAGLRAQALKGKDRDALQTRRQYGRASGWARSVQYW